MRGWTLVSLGLAASVGAQQPDGAKAYVTVSDPVVALTNVTVIDGTGAAPAKNETIVIQGGKIAQVGPAGSVQVPSGAKTMDLHGSTVIPGLVGMHDHLNYNAVGGREIMFTYSGPRLYLGSGVTTIRTTGTISPYQDLTTKHEIDEGQEAGPRIYV